MPPSTCRRAAPAMRRVAEAEEAVHQASRRGRDPHPVSRGCGCPGAVDAAEAAIRRVGAGAQDRVARSRLLPALVEIMFAAGDARAARAAADELSEMADDLDAPLLRALAIHGEGAVLLLEGDAQPRSARCAMRGRRGKLEVPYEAARARVLIGHACRELGDEETAEMELDAARSASSSWARCPTSRERRRCPGRRRQAGGRADRARAGGAAPGGDRQDEPVDRCRPVPEREDGGAPRQATSSPSWVCRAGRRRLPMPTSTTSYRRLHRIAHVAWPRDLGVSPVAATPAAP